VLLCNILLRTVYKSYCIYNLLSNIYIYIIVKILISICWCSTITIYKSFCISLTFWKNSVSFGRTQFCMRLCWGACARVFLGLRVLDSSDRVLAYNMCGSAWRLAVPSLFLTFMVFTVARRMETSAPAFGS